MGEEVLAAEELIRAFEKYKKLAESFYKEMSKWEEKISPLEKEINRLFGEMGEPEWVEIGSLPDYIFSIPSKGDLEKFIERLDELIKVAREIKERR